MIAARQIAFGKAAGAKKPYDAEIEYLESTGTQWIDTGVMPDNGNDISLDILVTKVSKYQCLIGMNIGGFGCLQVESEDLSLRQFNRGVNGKPFDYNVKFNVSYSIDNNSVNYSINGSTGNYAFVYYAESLKLLCSESLSYFAFARIFSFSVKKNGELILDLIPVRKGNIGYMYDRISGQLFGNQGTGEFVLGPDIIDYTAKDYVQDGLVAMWDGIENAGWGVHDSNAIAWKDLVGERDITSLKGNTFDDDSLFVSISSMNKVIPTKDIANSNSQLTYEIGGYATDMGQPLASLGDITGFRLIPYPKWGATDIYVVGPISSGLTLHAKNGGSYVRLTFALTYDGETAILYFPRDMLSKSEVYTKNDDTINGEITKYNQHIHFIRIYNRALTAEEIAHNYSIDKARFGL